MPHARRVHLRLAGGVVLPCVITVADEFSSWYTQVGVREMLDTLTMGSLLAMASGKWNLVIFLTRPAHPPICAGEK